MALISTLREVLKNPFPPEHVVAIYQHNPVNYYQFTQDVYTLLQQLNDFPLQRWALYHDEAYPFAVALFALLAAGKQVVIPGNITETTLQSLGDHSDALIGDMPNALVAIPVLANNDSSEILPALETISKQITIFTSGSTGEPKAIDKSLMQFQHELNALEACWGDIINHSSTHIWIDFPDIMATLCRTYFSQRASSGFSISTT